MMHMYILAASAAFAILTPEEDVSLQRQVGKPVAGLQQRIAQKGIAIPEHSGIIVQKMQDRVLVQSDEMMNISAIQRG